MPSIKCFWLLEEPCSLDKNYWHEKVQSNDEYGFIFQEAEEMHIKAIQIKEQLLGQEDYEVALSVGHLASLYNYDMNQYENAEKLYLRSIAIGMFFKFSLSVE